MPTIMHFRVFLVDFFSHHANLDVIFVKIASLQGYSSNVILVQYKPVKVTTRGL